MVLQCVVFIQLSVVTLCLLQPWSVLAQQQNQPHHGQHYQQQPQEGHGHGHHGKTLEFASEIHNADHILEHLQKVVSTKSKDQLSEEELEFHYFKLHDYDNNNKLDGVEIGKALTHFHDEGEGAVEADKQRVFADAEISNIVDSVIQENDENNDGYIEYFEFKHRQTSEKHSTP